MADDSVVHEREAAQEQEAPEPTGVDDDSLAILGLPRHAGAKDIEKLLATHAPGLAIRRVRLKPSVAIVKLESAEARDRALATLCGQKVVFKHYALKFDKAHTSEARLAKRKASEPGDGSEPKRPKTVEEAVTPLHAVGYEEQLALKAESIREVLGTLAKRLLKANAGGAWLSRQLTQRNGGRCCPQAEIVRAPATEGYRNKCEFTIGTGADGRPCVGFRLGQYRDGVTTVADPSGCAHVSAEMKRVVAAVQQVVRGSELPVVRSLGDGTVAGFWRQLLVRQNLRGELLISIMVRRAPRVPRARQHAPSRVSHARPPAGLRSLSATPQRRLRAVPRAALGRPRLTCPRTRRRPAPRPGALPRARRVSRSTRRRRRRPARPTCAAPISRRSAAARSRRPSCRTRTSRAASNWWRSCAACASGSRRAHSSR